MKSGIYKIINKIDGKYYVGRSVNMDGRIKLHFKLLSRGTHFNYKLQNAYTQFGQDNFRWEIVEQCSSERLCESEQRYLDECKSNPNLNYNISYLSDTIGLNDEVYRKISVANRGRKFTDEHKQKISAALKGIKRNSPSDETRQKMSLAHRGRLMGKDNPMFGKRFSDEQKLKWSMERKGSLNPNYGGKLTQLARDKISNTLKEKYKLGEMKIIRTVESIEKVSGIKNWGSDKNTYTFHNTTTKETYTGYRIEFQRKYNLDPNCLSKMVHDKQTHTKNWVMLKKEPPI
jgi:group I intron endonuclease